MKSTAPFGVTFDIGGLLSRTATVLRDDPVRFALLTVVPALLCGALATMAGVVGLSLAGMSLAGLNDLKLAIEGGSLQSLSLAVTKLIPHPAALVITISLASIICALIAVVAQSAISLAAEEVVRGGPRRSARQTVLAGIARLPALLAVIVVQLAVFVACSAPALTLAWAAAMQGSWALGLAAIPVGTVLFFVAAFVLLRLWLATAAVVVDELGPVAAIARAWQVSRGSMLDYLVAAVLMMVANGGLSVLASIVMVVPVLGWLAAAFITLVSMVAPSVWLVLAYAGLSDRIGHPGR